MISLDGNSISETNACELDRFCTENCKRKGIYNSPKWFGEWIKGVPDKGQECPYYIRRIGLFNKLKGKNHD